MTQLCAGRVAIVTGAARGVGREHALLDCSRLAESAIEATISCLVQTYALVFSALSDNERLSVLVSIGLSFMSIGYAYASFDHRAHCGADQLLLGL